MLIPVMMQQNVCVVHRGALGDFLTIWPALHALATSRPDLDLFWAGGESHFPWLAPLGYEPAPPHMRDWALKHCGADRPVHWPGPGDPPFLLWFGLAFSPFSKEYTPETSLFVNTIDRSVAPADGLHTRDMALAGACSLGAAPGLDWEGAWARLFGSHDPPASTRDVLLFPGSGHRAKQWPLSRFVALASHIHDAGFAPVFVLGPSELDRGLDRELHELATHSPLSGPAMETPDSLARLSELLLKARAVSGNDCGPMHLAGMFRTPGVVLFGPTAINKWSPMHLTVLAPDIPCRPCTATTAQIPCREPACMDALPLEAVRAALSPLLVSHA